MTDFEEWAKGYMRRSANLGQSVRQGWQDAYEAGYLKGYSVGRHDEIEFRDKMPETRAALIKRLNELRERSIEEGATLLSSEQISNEIS
jgi:hypothetical protein